MFFLFLQTSHTIKLFSCKIAVIRTHCKLIDLQIFQNVIFKMFTLVIIKVLVYVYIIYAYAWTSNTSSHTSYDRLKKEIIKRWMKDQDRYPSVLLFDAYPVQVLRGLNGEMRLGGRKSRLTGADYVQKKVNSLADMWQTCVRCDQMD